ncbi:MAG: cation:proton antiporter [Dehalococcoidia bacterium]
MHTDTGLLVDLVATLGIALAGGWLASRLRLSSIFGYMVAGIVISPFTPGFVGDVDRLRLLADIGVVLLLFGIGVQFSLSELAATGPRIAAGAVAQIAGVMAATWGVAVAFGWGPEESLFVAAAAAICSSTVIVKLLADRGDTARPYGRVSIAWSIVQDLVTVLLVAMLVAATGEGDVVRSVTLDSLKAVAFVAGLLLVGLRLVPWLLTLVAAQGSRELFVLAVAALALGTALASERVGLSLALGAFLAGLVVSESDLSHRVLGELLPTRDVFAVLFFVSIGMLIDPDVLADNVGALVALVLLMVVAKGALSGLLVRLAGQPRETSILTGGLVAQSGEFSFVLVGLGLDRGAVDNEVFSVVVAATAISIVLSPLALSGAHALVRAIEPPAPAVEPARPSRLGRRAVVCGYGSVGRLVAEVLAPRFEVVVADLDARTLRDAGSSGVAETINGDASSTAILERMRLEDCRVLIVALSDPFATRLVVERARAMAPDVDIVARALDDEEASRLRRLGANEAVVAGREVGLEMSRYGLVRFGVDARQAAAVIQRLRSR